MSLELVAVLRCSDLSDHPLHWWNILLNLLDVGPDILSQSLELCFSGTGTVLVRIIVALHLQILSSTVYDLNTLLIIFFNISATIESVSYHENFKGMTFRSEKCKQLSAERATDCADSYQHVDHLIIVYIQHQITTSIMYSIPQISHLSWVSLSLKLLRLKMFSKNHTKLTHCLLLRMRSSCAKIY